MDLDGSGDVKIPPSPAQDAGQFLSNAYERRQVFLFIQLCRSRREVQIVGVHSRRGFLLFLLADS